jgi:hypothetical protein
LFIADDPLGDVQRYVGNNPLGFTDPLGTNAVAAQQAVPYSLTAGVLVPKFVIPAIGVGLGVMLHLDDHGEPSCQVDTFARPRSLEFTGAGSKQNDGQQAGLSTFKGYGHVKKMIEKALAPLVFPMLTPMNPSKRVSGFLLSDEPGIGKSTLAQPVAHQTGL